MIDSNVLIDTVQQMKVYTFPSLAAIYGVFNEKIGELVGSGTFINLRGQTYLLTAGHVALAKNNYMGLAHTRSNGLPPAFIKNPFYIFNKFLDICVVKIEVGSLIGTGITPIDINMLAQNSNNLENDILFNHGYPGAMSKPTILLNAVFSITQPFGSFSGKSLYQWFDKRYHFALDYPQTNQIDENMSLAQLQDPHGLSGSAVWKTNRINEKTNWSPKEAKIVGIVHNWDDNSHSLIATRIEVVRKLLVKSIRQEFAYFHWIDRGSPLSDDWIDWFAACKEIPNI